MPSVLRGNIGQVSLGARTASVFSRGASEKNGVLGRYANFTGWSCAAGATTYVWSYENQMIGLLKPDGSRVTMDYNANFRRTKEKA